MRQDLLDQINKFSNSLAKVSTWHNSKDAFGHLTHNLSDGKKSIAADDYFYEFYCYLKVISDLNDNPDNQIDFIKNNGVFPRKTSKKTKRPFFKLTHKGVHLYDIQSGTKIETSIKGKQKAPDISFQKPNADPDLPSYEDVDIIYDAKYSASNNDKSFTESQMTDFNAMIRYIKTKKAKKIDLPYKTFTDFKGNCLITNKKSYTTNKGELKKNRITVVEDFDEGKTFNVIK